jgi:hypothetical protein
MKLGCIHLWSKKSKLLCDRQRLNVKREIAITKVVSATYPIVEIRFLRCGDGVRGM